nr:tRNA (adenine-n -)-methyltransferase non-catalytic subunit [Colletotrichum truncatum]KAF6783681.1 tRNA (adenine-n -)-methyltransferase non-catalytic subunit [Colletotrichum truncatum]
MKSLSVAVVGAGASGLVTAKYLSQAKEYFGVSDIEIRIFEREGSIGGVYKHRVYEDAEKDADRGQMVSSKYLTAFSDFRVPKEMPDFLPMEEYVRYLENYCSEFKLWGMIETNTEILRISRLPKGGHRVTYRRNSKETPHDKNEDELQGLYWDCDAIAICSGLNNVPSIPAIQGLENIPSVLHSSERGYNIPNYHGSLFLVKSDRALPYLNEGHRPTDILSRIRAFVMNIELKDNGGKKILTAPWPSAFAKDGRAVFPHSQKREHEEALSKQIRPDIVVLATGYVRRVCFLGDEYPKPDELDVRGIWRRGDVTTGFIGFVRPGIELQAQLWVLNLLRQKYPQQVCSSPESPDAVAHYEVDYALKARGGHDFFKTKHGVEQESYAYQLALDMGAAPNATFMMRKGFKAFFTWAMGSNFNAKFRLVGPWKWESGALAVMRGELFDVVRQTGGGVCFHRLYYHLSAWSPLFAAMHSLVKPNQWVSLKLLSEDTKVLQIIPNTTISLGKYGSFPTNLVIDRPFHLTYEIQDKREGENYNRLRVVPPSEIHADALADTSAEPAEEDGIDLENVIAAPDGAEFAVVDNESGDIVARSRREIIDDTARQTLTTEEIEALKQGNTDAGKDIIAKLLLSHTALDQKTAFSLAKYKLLKTKKYIRRFSIQPLDTLTLGKWLLEEKDAGKVLEMREEMMGLLGCWANVHFGGLPPTDKPEIVTADGSGMLDKSEIGGRWLVVDDTGGLVTAAMAERMGILYPNEPEEDEESEDKTDAAVVVDANGEKPTKAAASNGQTGEEAAAAAETTTTKPDQTMTDGPAAGDGEEQKQQPPRRRHPPRRDDFESIFAPTNTLTLIHPNSQPNLALLKYYNFDSTNPNPPYPLHPLATNLLPISWLQLLDPEEDVTYSTPPPDVSDEALHSWKANRRGNYHRKRRRWARTRYIVDSTRAGGHSGLVIASTMDVVSILRHTLPLLAGGAPIAIYSQSIEPLTELADCFSIARRAGWSTNPPAEAVGKSLQELERWEGSDDFPINPTLLLGANVQTSRARRWQVLPGRTHPMMMGRGGADGYIFTGWKAVPAEGKVEARGKFKRRKVEA